ncbi:MAG: PrgI family protein [Lachnospiraceae bacterium]|nr:PrgI family protein [Lachnospiraceae bacterium]
MAISVAVPKNLSGIKTKVALNLTKRQIICFSGAALIGVPTYFLTRGAIGTETGAILMVAVMLPFFFFAMYERDGFPAEKLLYLMIRQRFLLPGIRRFKSENIYQQLEEREQIKREVLGLEAKAKEAREAHTAKKQRKKA